jgi:NAD(P)-dependent dehydrogenase (short-subunit alcohol dehydrogenase family)
MSTVLVTGCSSGFGEPMARTLAAGGHCIYASMRGRAQRNAVAAQGLRDWSAREGFAARASEAKLCAVVREGRWQGVEKGLPASLQRRMFAPRGVTSSNVSWRSLRLE